MLYKGELHEVKKHIFLYGYVEKLIKQIIEGIAEISEDAMLIKQICQSGLRLTRWHEAALGEYIVNSTHTCSVPLKIGCMWIWKSFCTKSSVSSIMMFIIIGYFIGSERLPEGEIM